MRSGCIFIAGTDTGVGKTVVTGLLAKYLVEKNFNVVTQKWVQTGDPVSSSDISVHLKMMGRSIEYFAPYANDINPYCFSLAASPHLAARQAGVYINSSKIIRSFYRLRELFDFVLVEGAGGVHVPLSEDKLIIDLVEDLNIPVLLVAENRVGTINHTLLSVESLRSRNIPIIAVVLNTIRPDSPEDVILDDNRYIIDSIVGENNVFSLSFCEKMTFGSASCIHVLEQIYSRFTRMF
jgi:dethiobiotin synthetase